MSQIPGIPTSRNPLRAPNTREYRAAYALSFCAMCVTLALFSHAYVGFTTLIALLILTSVGMILSLIGWIAT